MIASTEIKLVSGRWAKDRGEWKDFVQPGWVCFYSVPCPPGLWFFSGAMKGAILVIYFPYYLGSQNLRNHRVASGLFVWTGRIWLKRTGFNWTNAESLKYNFDNFDNMFSHPQVQTEHDTDSIDYTWAMNQKPCCSGLHWGIYQFKGSLINN